MQAERFQKAVIKATIDSKDLDVTKNEQMRNAVDTGIKKKTDRSKMHTNLNTLETCMHSVGAQPMAGANQDVGNSTHFEWVCRSQSWQVVKDVKRHR